MVGPWSQLFPDLASKIAELVLTNHPDGLADYIRFRAVCVSWRSSTPPPPPLPLSPFPLLMLSFDEEDSDDTRSFFNISDGGRTHTLSLPFTRRKRIAGSVVEDGGGWLLVIIDNTTAVSLLNPLTSDVIHLPPLTTLSQYIKRRKDVDKEEGGSSSYRIYYPDDEFVRYMQGCGSFTISARYVRDLFLRKVVVSSAADGGTAVVVGISRYVDGLVFTRLGDDRWWTTEISSKQCSWRNMWRDVLAFQGGIYAVDRRGVVSCCQIGGGGGTSSPAPTITPITSSDNRISWAYFFYLVESSGDLLLVARFMLNKSEPRKFKVFKLDHHKAGGGRRELVEIKSLGDRMLFLGTNTSLCLSANSNYPTWKGNRIYFTPSHFQPNHDGASYWTDDAGVYNMD